MHRSHEVLVSRGVLAAVLALLTCCAAKPSAVTPPADVTPLPPWKRAKVLAAMVEPVDDPREACPADVAVYLRMDDLAAWRQTRDSDPLVAHVWESLAAIRPPQLWRRVADNLGMDDGELADAVFGRCTVLIIKRVKKREIPLVLARMDKAMIDRLPEACAMRPWEDGPRLGPYRLYRAPDPEGDVAYALGERWIAVASARHVDHLRGLLCAVPSGEASLADDEAFSRHIADLPARREALLLARSSSGGEERHALAVVRAGRNAAFHYSGSNPWLAGLDKRYVVGAEMDFSALPQAVLAAASINLIEKHHRVPRAVSMLLFPHTFERHVMGRIAPPVVAFFGGVDAEGGEGVPAAGVAIAMTDRRAAEDLDRLVVGVHLMTSLGKLDVLRLLFGMKRVEHDGGWYHVADFGQAIQKHVEGTPLADILRHPSSAGLTHVTFGPVGDWYVICSHEAMFRACLDAANDPSSRLTATADYGLMPFDAQREGLLISGLSRVSALAPMVSDAAAFWRLSGLRKKQGPYDAPLQWLAAAMQHRRVLSFQLWREGGDRLRGELRVVGEIADSSF